MKAQNAQQDLFDFSSPQTAQALRHHLLGEREEGFRVLRGSSKASLIANDYLARLKIKHHRYQEAFDLLDELRAATPTVAEVHFQKGVVYMGMHNSVEG